MTLKIAPSLLSADFAALGAEIAAVEQGGADCCTWTSWTAISFRTSRWARPSWRSIRRVARVPLDVHLMIEEPDRYIAAFVDAGASMISVHVEVLPHLHRTLQLIKSLGAKAGVAINPATPRQRDRGSGGRCGPCAGHVGQSRVSGARLSSREASLRSGPSANCSMPRATGRPSKSMGVWT